MMPIPSLWQSLYLLPFGVALSLCLSFLAYFWHIFRPLLDAFWVRFWALLLILKDFFGSFRQN